MITSMTPVLKQWIARAVALCVVGPICAMLASGVVASDGSHDTSFLTSHGGGAVALGSVLLLGLGFGVIVGRVVDRREGFLNIAFVFGWVAWTMGRMGEVYRIAPESGTFIKLAIEAGVIGLATMIALMVMTNPSKGMVHGHSDDVSRFDYGYLKESMTNARGLASMGVGLLAALVFAYIFGQTDLPGQSVGVGFGAGIFAGLGGAMAASSMQKKSNHHEPTAFGPIMLGVMLAGVVGPLVGLIMPGSNELVGLVVKGDLQGFLIVSPMAWTMGALLGVPVGHSWVEHSAQQAAGVQAKRA